MTADLVLLVTDYGVVALFLILAVNCLGVPFPSSLLMLATGSFAAQGDLDLMPILLWGVAGAVAGDQAGYLIGRIGGHLGVERTARRMHATALLQKAEAFSARWGGIGVFFSRWLFSPLGPYVNLVSGMTGLSWARFTVWGVAGEVIWVSVYVLLGFTFSESVQALADLLGNLTWFLAGAALTLLLGWKAVPLIRHVLAGRPAPGAGGGTSGGGAAGRGAAGGGNSGR